MAKSQPQSVSNILLDIFRAQNWFFGLFVLIIAGLFIGFAVGSEILFVYLLFVLLGIATRYPAARSPYDLSLMKPLTILLCLVDFRIAAFFAFTTWWIAKRWNPMEELTYTIVESSSIAVTALLSPILLKFAGGSLLLFALYFLLVHFILGACIITPIQRPGTLLTDFVFNVTEFGFTIFYNSLILILFAPLFFGFLGITAWDSGSFGQLLDIILRR